MDNSKSLSMGSEKWMKHVQQQAGVLSDLSEAIEGSPPASIAAMTTQLSTILRATIYNLGQITDDANGGITAAAAVTSRIRQVHRGAAMCLRVLVGKVVAQPTSTGSGPSSTNFPSAKPCIVVLISCLPHQGSSEEGNEKSTLEDPSETWIEVILTLQVLIRACRMVEEDDTSTQPSLDDLIVRLMGCTTHLLTISTNIACQVQAATLIDMLVERFATDKASLWQTLFPGTLAVLYRCLVSCQRQAATGLLVTLECSSLAIIRHLLLVTLRPIQMERTNAGDSANDDLSSAMHLLQNLQLSNAKSIETNTPDFLSKVQEKAVPPLLILLKQSMASRSSQVQSGVIQLARVLLVETCACWKETPRLIEVALEACLILQNSGTDHNGDDDSCSVASKARSVLKGYKTTGVHDRQVLQTKIRQLTQELPILSQGGKTVDLKMHLRLLLGYLQTLTDASGEGKAPLVASTFPYEPLIQLVEVDLDATSASSHVLLGEIKIRHGTGVSLTSKVPLKRLAFEQSQVLDQVLMAFGKALGPKQGAFVVDTLLAEIFEEWHRQHIPVSVLQQWTSKLAIARKVFCGVFARPANIGGGEKDERRRQKILRTLCSSILPVLMDPPLTIWRSKQVTLNIQQGMAAVQILSLELASTMVNHMEPDIVTTLISVMIYPVICMVHSGNGHFICQSAEEVLAGLVVASGLDSKAELVRKYSGMLFAETLSRIRVGADGNKLPDGDSGTLDAFRVLQWILEECCRVNSLDSMDPMPSLKNLVELFGRLLRRVDHLHLAKRVAEADAIAITGAYAALFKYFKTEVVLDDDCLLPKQPASWLDLLSVFEKPPMTGFNSNVENDSSDEDESVSTSAQATSSDSSLKSTVELSSEIMFRLCVLLSYPSLKVRIAACESLSSGFEYLSGVTSHLRGNDEEDSEIRNAIYRQVAKSWPSIKARLSLVTDEVVASQKPISSLIIVGKSQPDRHPGRYSHDNGVGDTGSLRFFLSRLYILIASMFECSGDFMADRFVSSVWPVMTKQLEQLLKPARVPKNRGAARSMIEEISATPKDDGRGLVLYEGSSRQSWVESERLLALSIFQCLKRVFSSPGSKGTVLIRIHQAVGLVLLPIIANPDDEVADSASRAVEAVILHDSDILLRPLLDLSGNGIPPIPAFLRGVVDSSTGETEVESAESPLQIRCSKLLDFIANLPDQELS